MKKSKKTICKDLILKYSESRSNNVDVDKFFNHYESNGWMVGKNKMKDWQASYRTWEPKKKSNELKGWMP